jgi:pimeloyl-ACP methyl ester carboxylesterase
MPFVKVGEENIFFSKKDTGSNQNLLLIHGSGGDHMHWPYQVRHLPSINVFAIDLPGHGRSEGQGYSSVDAYADFTAAFVSALNLKKVTLAGHSLGGAIAQCLAFRVPDWLARIILLGTGARLRVAPAMLEGVLSDFQGAADLICEHAYGPDAPSSLVQAAREALLKVDPKVIHGDFSACDQFDVMEKIGEISLPTLVISGTADQMTPVKYGEYLYQHIPGSRFSVIENGGHMMGLEKPEAVAEYMADFLRG